MDYKLQRKLENHSITPGVIQSKGAYLIDNRPERSHVFQLVNYDLADNSQANQDRMLEYQGVMDEINAALNGAGIAYKLQGSMAQAMQGAGVGQIPGDLDVLVPNPIAAAGVLAGTGNFQLNGGSILVRKLIHTATGIDVDLANMEDFGMNNAGTEDIEGVNVLDSYETILGLMLRQPIRQKDQIALTSLVVQNADKMTDDQKAQLAQRGGAPDWQTFYDGAFQAYSDFIMAG